METDEAEQSVKQIIAHAVPRALSLQEALVESNRDKSFLEVTKCIRSNIWGKAVDLRHYWEVRNDLIYKNGLLLRGDRLVIPFFLRDQVLRIAHLRITKTKQLLRTKVWWPGIDTQAEEMVNECDLCQTVGVRGTVKEPLNPTAMPINSWGQIHIDRYGPLPDGNSVLGIIDETTG